MYGNFKYTLDAVVLSTISYGEQYDLSDLGEFGWIPVGQQILIDQNPNLSQNDFDQSGYFETDNWGFDTFGAAFVAYQQSTNTAALVFRGSDSGLDWLDNIEGGVEGWSSILENFHALIVAFNNYVSAKNAENVLIVGHSLGGALAEQYLVENISENPESNYHGVTFASPGTFYHSGLDNNLIRFGHSGDIVFDLTSTSHTNGLSITIDRPDLSGIPEHYMSNYQVSVEALLHSVTFSDYRNSTNAFDFSISVGSSESEAIISDGQHPFYAIGQSGHDRIEGTAYGDILDGSTGDDTLFGFGGSDTIAGGEFNDYLLGGDGNDELRGGPGSDRLSGGAGYDTAYFDLAIEAYSRAEILGGDLSITEVRSGGSADTLSGIELVQFGTESPLTLAEYKTWWTNHTSPAPNPNPDDTTGTTGSGSGTAGSPDLTPSNVALSKLTASSGDSLAVSFTIRNVGTGSAADSSAGVYISSNATISISDTRIGGQRTDLLAPGASDAQVQPVVLPSNLTAGTWYIGVIADYDQLRAESNELNNASAGYAITITAPASSGGSGSGQGPDLVISRAWMNESSEQVGEYVSVFWDVKNQGQSLAARSEAGVYISTDAVLSAGDVRVDENSSGDVAAGETILSERSEFRIGSQFSPGNYYILVKADYSSDVAETSESNNVSAAIPFRIEGAPQPIEIRIVTNDGVTQDGGAGGTAADFDIVRVGDGSAIRVNWAVEGYGEHPASASDFKDGVLPSGQETLEMSDLRDSINIETRYDGIPEFDETYRVRIWLADENNGDEAVIIEEYGYGLIEDNDGFIAEDDDYGNDFVTSFWLGGKVDLNGAMGHPGDLDVFRAYLFEGVTYSPLVSGSNFLGSGTMLQDVKVEVLDSQGNLIPYTDINADPYDIGFKLDVAQSGEYFFRVSSQSQTGTGGYQLLMAAFAQDNDGSIHQSTPLTSSLGADAQTRVLTFNGSTTLTALTVSFRSEAAAGGLDDFRLIVTDISGNIVSGEWVSGGRGVYNFEFPVTGSDNYLLIVEALNADAYGAFDAQRLPAGQSLTPLPGEFNLSPSAQADFYNIIEDVTLRLGTFALLANDTDGDQDPLAVTSVLNAVGGDVWLDDKGTAATDDDTITFRPAKNFYGNASFAYTISDGRGGDDSATVSVFVSAVEDAPEAVDDAVTINHGASVTFDPRLNDSDAEGDVIHVAAVSGGRGTVSINADGTVTYRSPTNFAGNDSFEYALVDTNGGQDQGTVQVTINAPLIGVLSIAAVTASQAEGHGGSKAFNFTVTRSGDTSGASTAAWAVSAATGSTVSGADFSGGALPSGTVSFAAGESSKSIVVNAAGDTTVEASEAFVVTLSAPSTGTTIGTSAATATIANDDAALSIAVVTASQAEGNSGSKAFNFTVTRSGDASGTSTAAWAVSAETGSTVSGSDFTGGALPSGTVSFAAGESSKTIVVNAAGDTAVEASEAFRVTLSSPSTGTTIGTSVATATITNDDAATSLSISAVTVSQAEGHSGSKAFNFAITRSGDTSGASTAAWAVSAASGSTVSGSDFTGGALPSGTVSFAVGESSKTIVVNAAGDTAVEASETFVVTLSAPSTGTTIGTSAATSTISNDDASLAISVVTASQAEGNSGSKAFNFTVTRSGDTSGASTAAWAVSAASGSTVSGTDFTGGALPSGTVNFAAGESSKTVVINVAGETTVEASEAFQVTLSAPSTGTTIATSVATATITNDDAATSLAISAGTASQAEGHAGSKAFNFTVTRSGDTSGASTAAWAVSAASGSAVSGSDFTGGALPSGTVSFAAGESSKTIVVNAAGDTAVEASEAFVVTLSAPSTGTTIGTSAATATIANDDASLAISVVTASQTEGNSGSKAFNFAVTRTGDTSGTSTATWAVSAATGSTVSGSDFTGGALPSGTVSFAAGESSKTIVVNAAGDVLFEANEQFAVTLSSPSAGTVIGTPGASASIHNDDILPAGAQSSFGDTGANVLGGSSIADLMDGGGGDDQLSSGGGNDTVRGGDGGDYLAGEGGDDALFGEDGPDWLWAGQGGDTLDGGAEKDNLNGEGGDDVIEGGTGNDRITGRDGNDLIHAGEGNDWVGVWNDWGEKPELNYFPESGDDQIFGDAGDDVLSAGSGRDTVDGGTGNDYVAGEQDDDSLTGGEGQDWLWAGTGQDTLDGGALKDNLNGEGGNDLIYGGSGNDRICGQQDNDEIHAGLGDDWVGVWNDWGEDPSLNYFPEAGDDLIFGDEGNDVLSAGFGRDTVYGGGDNDYVAGEQGDDVLFGDAGVDWLWAGTGNDTLTGGAGADHLIGEGGADLFVFTVLSDLADRILDFSATDGDRIDISALLDAVGYAGSNPFGDGRLLRVQSGSNVLFSLDQDGTGSGFSPVLIATIENTTLSQLQNGVFMV